jgi:succinate dehydrogenase / fumarate reductase membrane anchor subunit
MKDFRTPLGKVRGLGAAGSGTGHFWRQRLTALANIPLTLFMAGLLIALNGAGYDETRAVLSQPLVAVTLILLLVSALVHMRLGMQTIIEDYVSTEVTKIALLALNSFFVVAVGAIGIFSILKLAFGG